MSARQRSRAQAAEQAQQRREEYYGSAKKARQMARRQRLPGMFADDDSDDDESGGNGRGSPEPGPAPAPEPEPPEPEPTSAGERRVDPTDGNAYTQREFVEVYGGTAEWDAARPRREEPPAPEPEVTEDELLDATDPLTIGEAFGSRILRDHLLVGAMESNPLDPFTSRQRGLVVLLALAITGLLTLLLVDPSPVRPTAANATAANATQSEAIAPLEISPALATTGATLAAFTASVLLQHVYESYQPEMRTVVPYRDTRTGEYGLAKLSEADGVAKDIEERAKR